VQLKLRPRTKGRGGSREGAGRPKGDRAPHGSRPPLASRFPVHVTLCVDESLPNLRARAQARVIEGALRAGKDRNRLRLVHYSIQSHHLHLIVEAPDAAALAAGIKGLSVRMAKRLNAALGRRGRVFVDRYFSRILTTPSQVRNCLAYVLLNIRRHDAQRGQRRDRAWIDPCSSGRFFDGWRDLGLPAQPEDQRSVSPARLWLLTTGWRLRGLIRLDEVPGAG
jgi:hypothetical protein